VFSTGIQDQGRHPRYLQRFRRSLSTSTLPARSSPARTSPPAFRPAARCPEGSSKGPTQHLAAPPGLRGFLGVLPNPSAFRPLVRCSGDPRSSRSRLLRDSSQPALLTRLSSPRVSIRRARRHFLPDSSRARRSPCSLSGFRLRFARSFGTSHRFCRRTLYTPVFGRFLSIPSGKPPCGYLPAVRNLLPSPRASVQVQACSLSVAK